MKRNIIIAALIIFATAALAVSGKILYKKISGESPQLVVNLGHYRNITSMACSPDGRFIATGNEDSMIILHEASTGRKIRSLFNHTGKITSLSFSPDGSLLASGADDKTITLWKTESGNIKRTLYDHENGVVCVAFSPDGKFFASTGNEGVIRVWDISSGDILQRVSANGGEYGAISFSGDGSILAGACSDNTIEFFDTATWIGKKKLYGSVSKVSAIAFHPSGKLMVTGSGTEIILWDNAGTVIWTRKPDTPVESVSFSKDGGMISVAGPNNLTFWDTVTGIGSVSRYIAAGLACFIPEKKMLVCSGSDARSFIMLDALTGSIKYTVNAQNCYSYPLQLSKEGRFLSAVTYNAGIIMWDTSSGKVTASYNGHNTTIRSGAFSPDFRLFASGDDNMQVKVWDISSGSELLNLTGHNRGITATAFSPDGRLLASGDRKGRIKLWSIPEGREIRTIKGEYADNVSKIEFSSDGKIIYSADGENEKVMMYDTATGTTLWYFSATIGCYFRIPTGEGFNCVNTMTVSPDGRFLATPGGSCEEMLLWDLNTKEIERRSDRNTGCADIITYSPDGSMFASADSATINIWNGKSGRNICELNVMNSTVMSLAFSSDSRLLYSAHLDQVIRLWDTDDEELTATIYLIDSGNYVIIAEDGRYDGTPGGLQMLYWVLGNRIIQPGDYGKEKHTPGLLGLIIKG
jgi:WD40 repeat protein